MEKNIPTYKIKVNEDDSSGVFAIALVDHPAIEIDFLALAKEIEREFFLAKKDKQMIYGPLLVPDKLIPRKDAKSGQEFNIIFDEETIELIADKFNKNKLGDTFNFMHSNRKVEAYLIENWLTGETDKSQDYGYKLPKGTWFGKVKVKDEKFWNEEVKTEKLKGFSVEIKSDIELIHLNNNKQNNINLMEIKTNEGVSLYFDGELAEGTVIFVDAEMTQFAPEGAHMLEDERVITVDAEGKIVAIAEETPEVEVEVETEMATEEVATTEEVVTEEKLAVTPEEIMVVVQPIFDQFTNTIAELTNKIAELEAKMNEDNKVESEMNELKSQVEKLSKSPAAESISKRDDVRLKRENDLLSKISMFRISTK
jgi:hypothetical protein